MAKAKKMVPVFGVVGRTTGPRIVRKLKACGIRAEGKKWMGHGYAVFVPSGQKKRARKCLGM